jgi:hypothetical protein
MGRYAREAPGYSQRSGRRVPRRLLVEDGDKPGLIVALKERDPPDPQKVPVVIPPEPQALLPATPRSESSVVILQVGYLGNPATSEIMQVPLQVLIDAPSPVEVLADGIVVARC